MPSDGYLYDSLGRRSPVFQSRTSLVLDPSSSLRMPVKPPWVSLILALSFALYGLAEYHRATGSDEAVDRAVRLFRSIEEHATDPVLVLQHLDQAGVQENVRGALAVTHLDRLFQIFDTPDEAIRHLRGETL